MYSGVPFIDVRTEKRVNINQISIFIKLTHCVEPQIPGKSKVTEFSLAAGVEEDVLGLDVSVEDSVAVEVVES